MAKCRGVRMNLWDKIFAWLVVIGAFNWGLAVFDWNLVTWITNGIGWITLAKIIYAIIGFSAIWTAVRSFMGFR